MKKGFVAFCKSALFATALVAGPGHAAVLNDASRSPTPASDKTIANIQQALDDQRYLDAGRLLDQAILVSGNDPRLTYWTGELNLARRRYEDALTNFKSIEADPKMAGAALEGEGIALAQLGRVEEAIICLRTAVSANPAAWRAWNALGSELDQRHDWAAADSAYAHAISVSGGAAIVLNNRGFSRLSQGKLEEAVADFVAALQKKPDLSSARNNLRLALAMKGEYVRAMAGAAAAEQATVLNNVGYAAMLRGDYANAKDLLERAMKAKGEYYGVAAANLETNRGLSKNSESAEHAPAH